MPSIDPKKLKRLKIKDLLAGFAISRGLSSEQLGDLVARAMDDKRFDLDASSDEFADFLLDEVEARQWAEELERSKKAPHLFTGAAKSAAVDQGKTIGGYTEAELSKMTPEQKLRAANAEFSRAKR